MKKLVVLGMLLGTTSLVIAGPWMAGDISYLPPTSIEMDILGMPMTFTCSILTADFTLGYGFSLAETFLFDIFTSSNFLFMDMSIAVPYYEWYPIEVVRTSTGFVEITIGAEFRWQKDTDFFKMGAKYSLGFSIVFFMSYYVEF